MSRCRVGLCMRLLSLLTVPETVRIKERLTPTGFLDYPHSNIAMSLDSSIQMGRLIACAKEPETVAWIEAFLRPGDVFYDIGANVGAYSFVAHAAARDNCTVYAFEPGFSTFAALSRNVFLNRCQGRIIPLHLALSDETKMTTFHYSSIIAGDALHSLGQPPMSGPEGQPQFVQPIPSYRLDDLVSQFALPPPNLIKLDVDGSESSVLRGAIRTLAHPRLRSILVEVDEEQDQSAGIRRSLEGLGLRLQCRHPRGQSKTVANCIFVRSDASGGTHG